MTKPTKRPSKCPKCGAKADQYCGYTLFTCWSEFHQERKPPLLQSDRCKLRVALRQLRKEKARMDALEKAFREDEPGICDDGEYFVSPIRSTHCTTFKAPTLRQLADKLLKA